MHSISDKSIEIIISILINEKIDAESRNKNGINNEYIKSIDNALTELKSMVNV